MRKTLCLLILLTASLGTASADVLVLVHGYASNAWSWERSGVNQALTQGGWQQVGIPGISSNDGANKFYTVELPANAPLLVQADYLRDFLQRLQKRHAEESLILVGHSAGGVVARLTLLQDNTPSVTKLITIASPHLGTPRAIQGLQIVDDKPFFCPGPGIDFAKSVIGGNDYDYLKASRGALVDLLPASGGNLLNWANAQVHPDIEYHAVIRQGGDELVPEFSQDLNQVPSLRNRAKVWVTRSGHVLNPGDGQVLLNILNHSG